MPILTSLAVATVAVATGVTFLKKTRRNATDRNTAVPLLRPSKVRQAQQAMHQLPVRLKQTQTLVHDLWGDSRQQYQQRLNVSYDASAEQNAEKIQYRRFSAAVTGLGLATVGNIVSPIFFLPSIGCTVYALQEFYRGGWQILREEKRIDYRAFSSVIFGATLAMGFIWGAAMGAIAMAFSRVLVAKTENHSKTSIANLFGDQVRTVWLLVEGVEVSTPLADVRAGDIVVVHAGQPIPVDGYIHRGTATVDQHALTGESQPVEKDEGDPVMAATLLLTGKIEVCVENAGEMTVAAQITQMLNQTSDFKQTMQSRTEKMLNQTMLPLIGISVLAMPIAGLGGAIAMFWYWPGGWMLTLGPLSMLSYLQIAAQKGILVKDGRALEVLQEIDTVVFDKTGTLTLEQPTVSRIICYDQLSETELLRYAAASETKQSHPIARAILQAAEAQELDLPEIEQIEYRAGYGLNTQIEGQQVHLGSIRLMQSIGITIAEAVISQQHLSHEQGNSMVFLALNHTLVGAIELMPTIRPEAPKMIDFLHQRGLQTVIISGDHHIPTQRLAADLGIERAFAEVLPEDKARLVEQLQAEGHKVCFVGDGINDSIALKKADMSISLRGATTIATDMAQIVFMDGSLHQLTALFDLTDEFAANMRTNVQLAVVPGVIGIAGTFLFGWGLIPSIFLNQISLPLGVYNTLKPLLDDKERRP